MPGSFRRCGFRDKQNWPNPCPEGADTPVQPSCLKEQGMPPPALHRLTEKQHILVKSDHIRFIEYTEAILLSSNNIIWEQ